MEQVYALLDRRCRTQTALDKLAKLRRRVQRFPSLGDTLKKLFAPTLEKALTFLDEDAATLDVQCSGTRQSALSQDAKECLPGADTRADQCAACARYVA